MSSESIKDLMEWMQKDIPKVEQILGRQVIDLLHEARITNLHLKDGLVCGTYSYQGYPESVYIEGLSLKIEGEKIIIDGKSTGSHVDEGKII